MIFAVFDPSPLTGVYNLQFLWPLYVIGQAIIFLPCGFYLLLSIFCFFPRLISAAAECMDVYHTSTHDVALLRI